MTFRYEHNEQEDAAVGKEYNQKMFELYKSWESLGKGFEGEIDAQVLDAILALPSPEKEEAFVGYVIGKGARRRSRSRIRLAA